MSEHALQDSAGPGTQREAPNSWIGGLWKGENLLMTFCLAAMVLLPLIDMALRSTTIVVPGSSAIQCHLTLFICMIGGAIAAREGRLLSLSTVTAFLKPCCMVFNRSATHCYQVFVVDFLKSLYII